MNKWDRLVEKFDEFQADRNKMDYDHFVSKYLILFNRNGIKMDTEEARDLLKEYRLEIDPCRAVAIVKNLNGVGKEEVVLRLPPIESEVPTLNECKVDDSIIDVMYNKLEQYSKNPHLKNGLNEVVLVTASEIADKAIEKLSEKDEYTEVMDELEEKLDTVDGKESTDSEGVIWE